MRIPLPSSRSSFRWRLSILDAGWAAAAPVIALVIRDAPILESTTDLARFWLISFGACLLAFAAFRLHQQLPEYFGVTDALAIGKASLCAEFLTSSALFFMTRLEGVPRSTLLIHALLISGGLLFARLAMRMKWADTGAAFGPIVAETEHIVLLGANRIAAAYIRLLDSIAPRQMRVVAVLDEAPELIGRSMAGIPIAGSISHLASIIDEFSVHGVKVTRVLVAGSQDALVASTMEEVEAICDEAKVGLDFVPELFGLGGSQELVPEKTVISNAPSCEPSRYFRFKRQIDIVASAIILLALAPPFLMVSFLAFLDVGAPVVFWQRRLGRNGHSFCLLKIRTLRAPYDAEGRAIPSEERLSAFGRFLRKTHLDELPQLLNVLVGDMSLIGPRPLLARDQPADPSVRLMVRPGISGWAQVNGGTLLTAAEKDVLDEWYIRNATLWLDIRIVLMSLYAAFAGPRRPKVRPSRDASLRSGRELALRPKAASARD
jgi:lipopolysaccharide/colanic/teichoic acid biosynthesis glycosyltransferase